MSAIFPLGRRLALPVLVFLAAWAALARPAAAQATGDGGFRKLAPGVMTTIPPNVEEGETVSTHDIVELRALDELKWTPRLYPASRTLYAMADDVKFRRRVAGLEFSFKPLRMIYVDVPQPSGKMQRKLIWYLVYRVRNTGAALQPVVKEADKLGNETYATYATEKAAEPIRFLPQFVLESHEYKKAYLDRVIPVATAAIQMREDPNRKLLNSAQIAQTPIPVSADRDAGGVWGVATWVDVDPRLDFFSVYVQGLSNAYKWADPEGVYQKGDNLGKGRQFVRKTLQLNFWRPGDRFRPTEEEIRFGTPPDRADLYGVPPGVDYVWLYR